MTLPLPEYDQLDAVGLAALVRDGHASPEELLDACVARIEARNPRINAVVTTFFERARAQVGRLPEDAPLRGVPFLLKHLLAELEGTPCTMSTRLRRDRVSTRSAWMVKRYEAGGLVFVGRTNTPEFGIMGVTEPALHGATRNPWDPSLSPGGSSGGAGAAVAARIVPAAHAGDGGGSIRIPAAWCGLVGLKPTRGRVSFGPEQGEGWGGLAQGHAVTRSVRDSALLLDLVDGPAPGDPYSAPHKERPFLEEIAQDPKPLRIAFTTEPLLAGQTDESGQRAVQDTAKLLRELGHEVVEARPPFDREAIISAYFTIVCAHIAANVVAVAREAGVRPRASDFEPVTWFMAQVGWATPASEYAAAWEAASAASRGMAPFFEETHDLFLCTTTAAPPPKVGSQLPTSAELAGLALLRALPLGGLTRRIFDGMADARLAPVPNTQLFNLTGQPAISLPLGQTAEGLPVGVQLVARMGGEGLLLQLAAQLERAQPWAHKAPAGL